MENTDTIYDGLIYLAIVIGFFAHALYENTTKTVPLAREPVTTNNGSIMMYVVWLAAIAVGTTAAILGLIWVMVRQGSITETQYLWTIASIYALAGALYNRAAIYRARDAGRSRGFALLAIVPIANLWVLFASPKAASERPGYTPAATPLRILVGLAAFVVIAGTRVFDTIGGELFVEKQVSDRVVAEVAATYSDLPRQLDEITILQAAETDRRAKEIVYRL